MLSLEQINKIADPKVRKQLKVDILRSSKKKEQKLLRSDFLSFVKHVWPEFVEGYHHKKISDSFNKILSSSSSKSHGASILVIIELILLFTSFSTLLLKLGITVFIIC